MMMTGNVHPGIVIKVFWTGPVISEESSRIDWRRGQDMLMGVEKTLAKNPLQALCKTCEKKKPCKMGSCEKKIMRRTIYSARDNLENIKEEKKNKRPPPPPPPPSSHNKINNIH